MPGVPICIMIAFRGKAAFLAIAEQKSARSDAYAFMSLSQTLALVEPLATKSSK
jgi:hypothetical protein